MELNWFIIYLFLWFYLRINSLWTALTALRNQGPSIFPSPMFIQDIIK
jgi:hypothetical protein